MTIAPLVELQELLQQLGELKLGDEDDLFVRQTTFTCITSQFCVLEIGLDEFCDITLDAWRTGVQQDMTEELLSDIRTMRKDLEERRQRMKNAAAKESMLQLKRCLERLEEETATHLRQRNLSQVKHFCMLFKNSLAESTKIVNQCSTNATTNITSKTKSEKHTSLPAKKKQTSKCCTM